MFDKDKFIGEVQKRPALYNIKLKDYNNKEFKMKLWDEIAMVMYENWNEISAEDKSKLGRDLQMKWKSMRDQFRREVNALKNSNCGQNLAKKKKYLYFDQLLFLNSIVDSKNTSTNLHDNDKEDCVDNCKVEIITPPPVVEKIQVRSATNSSCITSISVNSATKRKNFESATGKAITLSDNDHLTEKTNDVDKFGNKSFLMSVLPWMNHMKEDVMIDCRLKIMQVIQECRLKSRLSNYTYKS